MRVSYCAIEENLERHGFLATKVGYCGNKFVEDCCFLKGLGKGHTALCSVAKKAFDDRTRGVRRGGGLNRGF